MHCRGFRRTPGLTRTPNLLIRSQNQGIRPTLTIWWNPLCPLTFRLSLVRITYGRFSSSRGPNADETRLPGLESRFAGPNILPVMGGSGRVLCDGAARPLLMDRLFHPWSVMAERMRVMNVSE